MVGSLSLRFPLSEAYVRRISLFQNWSQVCVSVCMCVIVKAQGWDDSHGKPGEMTWPDTVYFEVCYKSHDLQQWFPKCGLTVVKCLCVMCPPPHLLCNTWPISLWRKNICFMSQGSVCVYVCARGQGQNERLVLIFPLSTSHWSVTQSDWQVK